MKLPRHINGKACLLCVVVAISAQVRLSDALAVSLIASNSALKLVENMASVVAAPPKSKTATSPVRVDYDSDEVQNLEGLGGQVYAINGKKELQRKIPPSLGLAAIIPAGVNPKEQVWTALSKLESNSKCDVLKVQQ